MFTKQPALESALDARVRRSDALPLVGCTFTSWPVVPVPGQSSRLVLPVCLERHDSLSVDFVSHDVGDHNLPWSHFDGVEHEDCLDSSGRVAA